MLCGIVKPTAGTALVRHTSVRDPKPSSM